MLELSYRQTKTLWRRYRQVGRKGLKHYGLRFSAYSNESTNHKKGTFLMSLDNPPNSS
jgi:hypothetical protein